MSLTNKLLASIQPHLETEGKVSIIGVGMVGMATAVSLLSTGVTRNLVLVDSFGDKVNGEILDLQHGAPFLNNPIIGGGNNYEATKGSKLCIVTTGVNQLPGESRLNLAQKNGDIMVKLIPELIKYSPDTIILMASYPYDVLSYVAWKSSGLPSARVIGVGTTLDTARFRHILSKRFEMNPGNIEAWIIGEHGEHSIALWSTFNIAGMRLQVVNPYMGTGCDAENWTQCHKEVVETAQTIIELKGYTNWGLAMSITAIAKAILTNSLSIFPVSVNAKGRYGIHYDVYIPLLSIVGSNGVTDIIDLNLGDKEIDTLQTIAKVMKELQDGIASGSQARKCHCTRCKKKSS